MSLTYEYRGSYTEGDSSNDFGPHQVNQINSSNKHITFAGEAVKYYPSGENSISTPEDLLKTVTVYINGLDGNFSLLASRINSYFMACFTSLTVKFSFTKRECDVELQWIDYSNGIGSYVHGVYTPGNGNDTENILPTIKISEIVDFNILPVFLIHELFHFLGDDDRLEDCSKNLMARHTFNNSIRITPAQSLKVLGHGELINVPDVNVFPLNLFR